MVHGRKNEHQCGSSANQQLCLPKTYSKFELPYPNTVNVVEIGIDISDVLRINDKVSRIMRTVELQNRNAIISVELTTMKLSKTFDISTI